MQYLALAVIDVDHFRRLHDHDEAKALGLIISSMLLFQPGTNSMLFVSVSGTTQLDKTEGKAFSARRCGREF